MTDSKFRILSLDGGGVRGSYQANFIKFLEEKLPGKGRTHNEFDLICGTSTGAIIAAGLACNVSALKLSEFYKDHSSSIFNSGTLGYITPGPRYKVTPLEQQLRSVLGERTFEETKTGLYITASHLDRYGHKVFTNCGSETPDNLQTPLYEIVLASTAAPSYFPSKHIESDDISYVDGGLWANSPAFSAISWVNQELGVKHEDIILVSLGTGYVVKGLEKHQYDKLRSWSPDLIKNIFEMMFSAQTSFYEEQITKLIPAGQYLRIDHTLDSPIDLDDHHATISKLPTAASLSFQDNFSKLKPLLPSFNAFLQSNAQPAGKSSLIDDFHNASHNLRNHCCELYSAMEESNQEQLELFDSFNKEGVDFGTNQKLNESQKEKISKHLEDHQDNILKITTKFLSAIFSDLHNCLTLHMANKGITEQVHCCLKLIPEKSYRSIDISEPETYESLSVITAYRDYRTHMSQSRGSNGQRSWSIKKNSAFSECYNGKDRTEWSFIQNDLKALHNKGDYNNERKKFWEHYNATIVVPVQDNDKCLNTNIYGFLAADCLNEESKEIFTEGQEFPIMAFFADTIATFFRLIDQIEPDLYI